ncbi:VCBS repeat-containing protein [Flagellimonas sp.]|uniref:VCBS repeat-containing protein n=1 Tax=Flagellimonas sp. TaxID=2058762 RepID=UPI003B503A55
MSTTNARCFKNFFYASIVFLIFSACTTKTKKLLTHISSNRSGIEFNNQIIETDSSNILNEEYIFNGGGVAVGDFNNDELPDLFFSGNQVDNKLYLNKGNLKFSDVSSEANIEAKGKWSTGTAIVDINADGWLDIYVCAAMHKSEKKRANMLFVNQGLDQNGVPQFVERAKEVGIAEVGNSMGAAFFDYDKDGYLDLYVLNNEQEHTLPTNYRPKINDGSAASNDRLYHNNGDGTFTDLTIEAGIVYEGFGLGIAVTDINYDGWPDIHISNDYLTNDILYINNTDGTFSNRIEDYIKHQSQFSMGSDVADYDNDGFVDIITLDMLGETNYRMKTTVGGNNYITYVLNERYDYQYQYMRNMLHKGNGPDVPSSEIGLMAGISKTDWSWSPLFADIDNDGLKDLLITNGFPRDITDKDFADFNLTVHQYLNPSKILDSIPIVKSPNYAYKNLGDSSFEDVGESWGLNIPSFSNGAVLADLDNDGDLDYVVNNINDKAFLFENNANESKHNFLNINLEGPKENPMGIGAKIVIRYTDGTFQIHEQNLTRGYMSSVDPKVHFGLGAHDSIKSVEIVWPDGKFQKLTNIIANQLITLSYLNARPASSNMMPFPFALKKNNDKLFVEISKQLGIDYEHKEADIVDFNLQRTLPHKLSQNGPSLIVGDINGDGFEDFIIGSSSKFSPSIFLQHPDGKFTEKPLFTNKEEMLFEEEDMALFDLDNDGDLDLYLVSGSYEFEQGSPMLNDRLYLNDGNANFVKAVEKMPVINANGSVVAPHDFDNDGFTDLFIGGRTPTGKYPAPEKSYLLKNNGGKLEDVTGQYLPKSFNLGMVTDAIWTDVDNDQLKDLVVVGELMPITILKNQKTSFVDTDTSGLENYLGWWESIQAADMDNDGDMDFVVGNMGANNFYAPTHEKPVTVIAKDFDKNGSIDPITFAYFKNKQGKYESFPVDFWSDVNSQSTLFRSKFNLYSEYAEATQKTLLNPEELKGAITLTGNYDKSSYVENLGDGTFKIHALPLQAQLAPINDIEILDFDQDGNLDILLVGNDYGNETFIGRYDAFNGLLLRNDGTANFAPISHTKSGFLITGDAKSIAKVKTNRDDFIYVTTQNRNKALIYKLDKKEKETPN